MEDLNALLRSKGRWAELVRRQADISQLEKFRSIYGRSRYQTCTEMFTTVVKRPFYMRRIDTEMLLRKALGVFSSEQGRL